jgi:phosphoribulokinase
MEQALRHLREGDPILKAHLRPPQRNLRPAEICQAEEFVIAEGLLGYTTRTMRDCYDVKIYLDPDEDLRVKWKMHRDTTKARLHRGRRSWPRLRSGGKDAPKYMHPQRTFADIVYPLPDDARRQRLDTQLDVRQSCARPCPHPDFGPLFERLEQCRLAARACPRP